MQKSMQQWYIYKSSNKLIFLGYFPDFEAHLISSIIIIHNIDYNFVKKKNHTQRSCWNPLTLLLFNWMSLPEEISLRPMRHNRVVTLQEVCKPPNSAS